MDSNHHISIPIDLLRVIVDEACKDAKNIYRCLRVCKEWYKWIIRKSFHTVGSTSEYSSSSHILRDDFQRYKQEKSIEWRLIDQYTGCMKEDEDTLALYFGRFFESPYVLLQPLGDILRKNTGYREKDVLDTNNILNNEDKRCKQEQRHKRVISTPYRHQLTLKTISYFLIALCLFGKRGCLNLQFLLRDPVLLEIQQEVSRTRPDLENMRIGVKEDGRYCIVCQKVSDKCPTSSQDYRWELVKLAESKRQVWIDHQHMSVSIPYCDLFSNHTVLNLEWYSTVNLEVIETDHNGQLGEDNRSDYLASTTRLAKMKKVVSSFIKMYSPLKHDVTLDHLIESQSRRQQREDGQQQEHKQQRFKIVNRTKIPFLIDNWNMFRKTGLLDDAVSSYDLYKSMLSSSESRIFGKEEKSKQQSITIRNYVSTITSTLDETLNEYGRSRKPDVIFSLKWNDCDLLNRETSKYKDYLFGPLLSKLYHMGFTEEHGIQALFFTLIPDSNRFLHAILNLEALYEKINSVDTLKLYQTIRKCMEVEGIDIDNIRVPATP